MVTIWVRYSEGPLLTNFNSNFDLDLRNSGWYRGITIVKLLEFCMVYGMQASTIAILH